MNLALWSGPVQTWGFGDIVIAIVIVAAVIALLYVALRQFNVVIPPWLIQCLWIVAVAFVVIMCIRVVLSL